MYGYPTPQQLPGRGEECVRQACEQVTLVWSNNPAAWVGISVCVLTLLAWWKCLRTRPDEAEEGENDANQR